MEPQYSFDVAHVRKIVCFMYIIRNTIYKSYSITLIIINLIIIIIVIFYIIFSLTSQVVKLNYLSFFVSVSYVGLTCLMYFVIYVLMLCSFRYGPFGCWLSTLINKNWIEFLPLWWPYYYGSAYEWTLMHYARVLKAACSCYWITLYFLFSWVFVIQSPFVTVGGVGQNTFVCWQQSWSPSMWLSKHARSCDMRTQTFFCCPWPSDIEIVVWLHGKRVQLCHMHVK